MTRPVKTSHVPPDPPTVPLLLGPEAAARFLGVSRSRIYELMGSGRLKSRKIGSSRRIARSELERFAVELFEEPTP